MARILFLICSYLSFMAVGYFVRDQKIFPYEVILSGLKTGKTAYENLVREDEGTLDEFLEFSPEYASSSRLTTIEPTINEKGFLFHGGRFQFMELCPETEGCLAAQYTADGKISRSYPFRAEEIFNANITLNYPYETIFFDFKRDARPLGISQYPNGDLIVVFQNTNTFPFGGGVARINQEGKPLWFRRDYSHHWPRLIKDEIALVPGLEIDRTELKIPLGEEVRTLGCETGKIVSDSIRFIDKNGKLIREISVLNSILNSPYGHLLLTTINPCDPLHLNFIDVIEDTPTNYKEITKGDLVVSLRNLNAFAILEATTGRVKHLKRGTFVMQHSVHHLKDSQFLMFDNRGRDSQVGKSRLLLVDLARDYEKTIFPTKDTPKDLKLLYSGSSGKIDLSSDRKRVIFVSSADSIALEIRIADSKILRKFRSVHDVSKINSFPIEREDQAARFFLYGVDYID